MTLARDSTDALQCQANSKAVVCHLQSRSVPAACPMRWFMKGYQGRSRTTPHRSGTGSTYTSLLVEET
jgi:hypothetical protein